MSLRTIATFAMMTVITVAEGVSPILLGQYWNFYVTLCSLLSFTVHVRACVFLHVQFQECGVLSSIAVRNRAINHHVNGKGYGCIHV